MKLTIDKYRNYGFHLISILFLSVLYYDIKSLGFLSYFINKGLLILGEDKTISEKG